MNTYKNQIDHMLDQMEETVIGKRKVLKLLLVALFSGGHVLLEDVPGVGKTTIAKELASAIQCGFQRIQFTPDTLPSDITGLSVYNMQKGEFEFVKGAIMNHIILADEINRTSPKTQASLLEAMQENQVTVDGTTYPLKKPFMVIATQNPIEHIGTYHLPEAQLDRFMMKLSIGYPNFEDEIKLLQKKEKKKQEQIFSEQGEISEQEVLAIQEEVRSVYIHDDLIQYIVDFITRTRKTLQLTLGASPRASIMVMEAAKAYAYIEGREFVIPEDILYLLPHMLPHRLLVSSEGRIQNTDSVKIVEDLIKIVKIPVLPDVSVSM
jgi:MoxR-like ATPase